MSDTVTSTRTAASIIDGAERTDAPGGRLESTNPANRSDVVAEVLLTDAEGFVAAARAARAAQREWASVPAPARGRVIAEVGRLFEANKEALARLVTREIGKPYPEALGEVQEIIDTCDFFLGEGRRLYGQTVPSEMPDKQLFTFRVPVGVAAIITAGNFPGAVPSWYLVPAILCGNAVVWKPAEYSAAIASAMTELFHAGGVPSGVLNLVHADGPATFGGLERALDEGLVDKVGFTGSSAVGARDRRPLRPQPPVAVPRARRQEPDGGHGRRGPRPRRGGRAVRRLRHRGPALHVARHGDRPRERPRRVRAPARRAPPHVADRRPDGRRPLRPDDPREVRRALRGVARADPRPPHRPRLDGDGAHHGRRAARGLRRRPGGRDLLPPDVRDRRHARRRALSARRRSDRSSASRGSTRSTRR